MKKKLVFYSDLLCTCCKWFQELACYKIFLLTLIPTANIGDMEIRSSTNYIWNIKDVLGQGATGAVYKGRHKVIS